LKDEVTIINLILIK